MSSTVFRIAEQLEARRIGAIDAYRELVWQTAADDDSTSIDEIERILLDAGKTIEEFACDERQCRRRNEWREAISNAPKIKSEIAEAEAGIAVADGKLEAAKKTHSAAVSPLRKIIGTAQDSLRNIADARRELAASMWPEDAEELKRLEGRCQKAHREVSTAKESLLALKSRMPEASPQRNNYGWLTEAEVQAANHRRAPVKQEHLEKAKQRLAVAEQKLSDAMAERDEFIQAAAER